MLAAVDQGRRGASARAGRRSAGVLLAWGLLAGAEPVEMPVGVTAAGSPIHALVTDAVLDPNRSTPSILIVAGLDGRAESTDLAAALVRGAGSSDYSLSCVLNVFPDREPNEDFPPAGPAYRGPFVESQYVWRMIGMLGPDLVVDLRTDQSSSNLATALKRGAIPAGVGRIPAAVLRLSGESRHLNDLRDDALDHLDTLARDLTASPARRELRSRLARTPVQTAAVLEQAYGQALDAVTYIPALALVGRLHLGDLDGTSRLADVAAIVRPHVEGHSLSDGPANGSSLAGRLVFGELFRRTERPAYLQAARTAAGLGFQPDGSMKASMPFHNGMSDSVFMGCPILTQIGSLTGDRRYYRMALRHLRFMQSLDLRRDGLYRHSPLDQAAWGRGNGFPALGLALSLSDWPPDDSGYSEVLEAFRSHLRAVKRHQDPTGMWHQVVDRPESYREFTSTAMIGFALTRGLRRGWLDRNEFEATADRAWRAVQMRIKNDATLVDVCRSTGRQASLRAYFDREAILGTDARGGAVGLLVATERARWERER